jgi:excisionase family DNA binding protein
MTKLLYTAEEAAELLGIGRSTFYLLLASGEVDSVKIGVLRRIPAAALDRYVERLSQAAAGMTGGSTDLWDVDRARMERRLTGTDRR